jgi:hypothetical protein
MSELPGRPDLDQLRRQARELLRAAADGEPSALTRIRAFSGRVSLSAAQLTLAREHGFASWPALHAEVERRLAALAAAADRTRWSFGGATALETPVGTLYPGGLVAGPDHAFLDASLMPPADSWSRLVPPPGGGFPQEEDRLAASRAVIALAQRLAGTAVLTDDQGMTYSLRAKGINRDAERELVLLDLKVDPVPPAERAWLELRVPGGSAVRLLPSARPDTRVSRLEPIPGTDAERELSEQALTLLDSQLYGTGQDEPETESADGAQLCLDLAADLPRVDDVAVRVSSLVSEPGTWRIYLSAEPGWGTYSADRQQHWPAMAVHAEDDLGGRYISRSGGGSGYGDHEEHTLDFRPRLNALARALTLVFRPYRRVAGQVTCGTEQITVRLRLPQP